MESAYNVYSNNVSTGIFITLSPTLGALQQVVTRSTTPSLTLAAHCTSTFTPNPVASAGSRRPTPNKLYVYTNNSFFHHSSTRVTRHLSFCQRLSRQPTVSPPTWSLCLCFVLCLFLFYVCLCFVHVCFCLCFVLCFMFYVSFCFGPFCFYAFFWFYVLLFVFGNFVFVVFQEKKKWFGKKTKEE